MPSRILLVYPQKVTQLLVSTEMFSNWELTLQLIMQENICPLGMS